MWLDWGCEKRGKEQSERHREREGERGRGRGGFFCSETLELWRGVFVLEQYNTWWRFSYLKS